VTERRARRQKKSARLGEIVVGRRDRTRNTCRGMAGQCTRRSYSRPWGTVLPCARAPTGCRDDSTAASSSQTRSVSAVKGFHRQRKDAGAENAGSVIRYLEKLFKSVSIPFHPGTERDIEWLPHQRSANGHGASSALLQKGRIHMPRLPRTATLDSDRFDPAPDRRLRMYAGRGLWVVSRANELARFPENRSHIQRWKRSLSNA